MSVEETIKNEIEGMEQRLAASQQETLSEVRNRLDSLEERDTTPGDEKVADLEKRLADREAAEGKLKEQIRLLEANPEAPERGQSRNATHPEDADFRGWFIRDVKEARDHVRAFSRGEVRAIDSSLFTNNGDGEMGIEEQDRFIDMIVRESETLSRITTRRMVSNSGAIDELRVGARTIAAATEGTSQAVADSISIQRRTLSTVETILAEDITLTFLEDNIERGGVEAHIAEILAKSYGTQLNDLGMNGDGTTAGFLAINTGFIKLMRDEADVADHDASSDSTAKEVLNKMLRTMPNRFRSIGDLMYVVPVGFAQTYADEFAARETNQGDTVFVNGFPSMRYFGRPVIPEPALSEATTGVESDDAAFLTPASNLVHGIQRQFTVDAEWNPRARVMEYTMTARNDYEFATGQPIVLASAIPTVLL